VNSEWHSVNSKFFIDSEGGVIKFPNNKKLQLVGEILTTHHSPLTSLGLQTTIRQKADGKVSAITPSQKTCHNLSNNIQLSGERLEM
jgi:hypothetical protein